MSEIANVASITNASTTSTSTTIATRIANKYLEKSKHHKSSKSYWKGNINDQTLPTLTKTAITAKITNEVLEKSKKNVETKLSGCMTSKYEEEGKLGENKTQTSTKGMNDDLMTANSKLAEEKSQKFELNNHDLELLGLTNEEKRGQPLLKETEKEKKKKKSELLNLHFEEERRDIMQQLINFEVKVGQRNENIKFLSKAEENKNEDAFELKRGAQNFFNDLHVNFNCAERDTVEQVFRQQPGTVGRTNTEIHGNAKGDLLQFENPATLLTAARENGTVPSKIASPKSSRNKIVSPTGKEQQLKPEREPINPRNNFSIRNTVTEEKQEVAPLLSVVLEKEKNGYNRGGKGCRVIPEKMLENGFFIRCQDEDVDSLTTFSAITGAGGCSLKSLRKLESISIEKSENRQGHDQRAHQERAHQEVYVKENERRIQEDDDESIREGNMQCCSEGVLGFLRGRRDTSTMILTEEEERDLENMFLREERDDLEAEPSPRPGKKYLHQSTGYEVTGWKKYFSNEKEKLVDEIQDTLEPHVEILDFPCLPNNYSLDESFRTVSSLESLSYQSLQTDMSKRVKDTVSSSLQLYISTKGGEEMTRRNAQRQSWDDYSQDLSLRKEKNKKKKRAPNKEETMIRFEKDTSPRKDERREKERVLKKTFDELSPVDDAEDIIFLQRRLEATLQRESALQRERKKAMPRNAEKLSPRKSLKGKEVLQPKELYRPEEEQHKDYMSKRKPNSRLDMKMNAKPNTRLNVKPDANQEIPVKEVSIDATDPLMDEKEINPIKKSGKKENHPPNINNPGLHYPTTDARDDLTGEVEEESEEESEGDSEKTSPLRNMAAKTEAKLRRSRRSTYTEPIRNGKNNKSKKKFHTFAENEEYIKFLLLYRSNFTKKKLQRRKICTKYSSTVGKYYRELVPKEVSAEDFWERYFYRCDPDFIKQQWDHWDQ